MSEKKLLSVFMEKMATDKTFALKVAAMQSPESLVELSTSVGFALTPEQAAVGLEKIKSLLSENENLDEDELEAVSGGRVACEGEC